jgi:hypothetical protein
VTIEKLSSNSTEFVKQTVSAEEDGLPVDPHSLPVQMAFTLHRTDPVPDDWRSAQWEIDNTFSPPVYKVRCLVGPLGTGALAKGS